MEMQSSDKYTPNYEIKQIANDGECPKVQFIF